MLIVAVLLLAHILLCLLTYALLRRLGEHAPRGYLALCVLLPVLGALSAALVAAIERRAGARRAVEYARKQDSDEIYHSITVEKREDESVVPLEDALSINSVERRRSMLLDVLRDDPSQYLDALSRAQQNDDSEVVHYATTALSEQIRQMDLALKQREQAYHAAPDDADAVRAYVSCLGEYLDTGLLEGSMADKRTRQYRDALSRLYRMEHQLSDGGTLCELMLDEGDVNAAAALLEDVASRYPEAERTWMLLMRLRWTQGDRDAVRCLVRSARDGRYHLSHRGADSLKFWSGLLEDTGKEAG